MDPGDASDGELLAATSSHPDAFAAFYDRYETAVVGCFTRRTGDPEVVADLTAEVFAAALGAARRYRTEMPTAASFTARLAVNDARRIYGMHWREPGMPPGAYGGEATNSNIAAGQTVTKTIGEYGPRVRAGIVHGTVTLRQALGAGGIEGPESVSVPVGRFAVRVP